MSLPSLCLRVARHCHLRVQQRRRSVMMSSAFNGSRICVLPMRSVIFSVSTGTVTENVCNECSVSLVLTLCNQVCFQVLSKLLFPSAELCKLLQMNFRLLDQDKRLHILVLVLLGNITVLASYSLLLQTAYRGLSVDWSV